MIERRTPPMVAALSLAALLILAADVGAQGQPMQMSSEYVQDLVSMTGRAAPAFTLRDAEAQSVSVKPGDGKRHVIVFHMGSV